MLIATENAIVASQYTPCSC